MITARHLTTTAIALYVLFLAVMGSLWIPGVASAAPLAPYSGCSPNLMDQSDMAGTYESLYMRVTVAPCSTIHVEWLNSYGPHEATYITQGRLPGGGLVSYGFVPDPQINAYLDAVTILAVKPAEKGYVQIATITDDDMIRQIYRLHKTQ